MGAALEHAVHTLETAGVPLARREGEHLLAYVLKTDRGGVAARRPDPLSAEAESRFTSLLSRRAAREPLQYLTGTQEFRGRRFRVDRRVLVPRPETELVVDAALDGFPSQGAAVDLGTGSGCIAISIAVECPEAQVHALDSSADALDLAAENASQLGAKRVEFRRGDMLDPPMDWRGRMDLVVSNPPYVAESEWESLEPEVRDYEPKQALVPGPMGDEMYGPLARAAFSLLVPRGRLVAELGHTNEPGARAAAIAAGFIDVTVSPDLRGIPRILVGRKPPPGEQP